MKTNPLIVKSDVGQVQASCLQLSSASVADHWRPQITRTTFSSPKEGIIFGNPNIKDPENAKEGAMV
jgi:hypothetical protein